ncbi:hypothetical protein HHL17_26540 [Chitinophaga sp. G-6-1-13]|uniref:Secreted protein n=1 Tax=Chitinophaga fulva TaxID=2728842 RepID=A0A848GQW4_9BACT|nr:hypothetical protein [Chitinophaga fulva]NML40784.1 hypothetical protein [Chitinophaga fulva]
MKKVKILLSTVAVVALIAGAVAVNARQGVKVYTHGPLDPAGFCGTAKPLSTFLPDQGNQKATSPIPAPCVNGLITTDSN